MKRASAITRFDLCQPTKRLKIARDTVIPIIHDGGSTDDTLTIATTCRQKETPELPSHSAGGKPSA